MNTTLKVGDIAFVKGGVPIQVKEILRLPNDTHYHIELLQKVVGKGDLEIPMKAVTISFGKSEESMTNQQSSKKEPDRSPVPPRKRAKFNNEDIYKPSFPTNSGPRQSKTSTKAAAINNKSSLLPTSNEKSKNETENINIKEIQSPPAVSPTIIPSAEVQTRTQCSQDDYFSLTDEKEAPEENNGGNSDGHCLVKISELPYYKFGRGINIKNPSLNCRICKRKCGWACTTCSDDATNCPIHHPKSNPECFASHLKATKTANSN